MSYSPLRGTGALVNVITVNREDVKEFDDWYSFQHFPERLAVPGFHRGRRYVSRYDGGAHRDLAASAHVRVFSLYETHDTATLTSPAYLAALDSPTDWTKHSVGLFQTNVRSVCHVLHAAGVGRSGHIFVVEIHPLDTHHALAHLTGAIDGLIAERRILSGYVLATDMEATNAKDSTAEGRVAAARAAHDQKNTERWYVVFEVHGSLAVEDRIAAIRDSLADGPWTAAESESYELVSDREID